MTDDHPDLLSYGPPAKSDSRSLDEQLEDARSIIHAAIAEHRPSHVFGLFSGGNDSLTVTHFAADTCGALLDKVVHINTGIGLPETRAFVIETAVRMGWPLLEIRAKEDCGQDYDEIVVKHGFPGPAQHNVMFNLLKERAIRKLLRDHKDKNRCVMLISGARRQESGRRMRLKSGAVHRDSRKLWCSPFFNLSNDEIREYRERHEIPESPVRQYLCMSGECLCGAFARPNELGEIRMWFPDTAARIEALQLRVASAGKPCRWGHRPPAKCSTRSPRSKPKGPEQLELEMLCTSCEARFEREDETKNVS